MKGSKNSKVKKTIPSTILVQIKKKIIVLILAKMPLPVFTPCFMDEKLSSVITISEVSLAKSVPVIPIATPAFANFRAGASLIPSPVIAHINSCF